MEVKRLWPVMDDIRPGTGAILSEQASSMLQSAYGSDLALFCSQREDVRAQVDVVKHLADECLRESGDQVTTTSGNALVHLKREACSLCHKFERQCNIFWARVTSFVNEHVPHNEQQEIAGECWKLLPREDLTFQVHYVLERLDEDDRDNFIARLLHCLPSEYNHLFKVFKTTLSVPEYRRLRQVGGCLSAVLYCTRINVCFVLRGLGALGSPSC